LTPSGIYDLTLFFAPGTPPETIDAYLEGLPLFSEQIHILEADDPAVRLRRFGLLKVMYTQFDGVAWFERGNDQPAEYHAFHRRLEQTIAETRHRMANASGS